MYALLLCIWNQTNGDLMFFPGRLRTLVFPLGFPLGLGARTEGPFQVPPAGPSFSDALPPLHLHLISTLGGPSSVAERPCPLPGWSWVRRCAPPAPTPYGSRVSNGAFPWQPGGLAGRDAGGGEARPPGSRPPRGWIGDRQGLHLPRCWAIIGLWK